MTMDDNEKRNISLRLSHARAVLLKKYPFFGNMVMNLSFGLDDSCGTAYTDMQHIIFDPQFADRLSDEELEFVLMHEVMHCVLNHCVRGRGKISLIYNIACDIVVNSNILDYMNHVEFNSTRGRGYDDQKLVEELVSREFKVDGEPVIHLTPSKKEGRLFSAEEIYEELISSKEFKELEQAFKCLDSHDIWNEIDNREQDADKWDKIVKDYGSRYGNPLSVLPQSVRSIFEDGKKQASIRWKDYLRDFVSSFIDVTDYSFSPPDRRFSGNSEYPFLLPGENTFSIVNGPQGIWFAVDTSGSISQKELTRLCGEVMHVIEECPGASGYISFFDTLVTEPVPFSEKEDFDYFEPKGGGGTSFAPIFKYMEDNMITNLPKAIVIMTDGYAPDVPMERALGVPVLWVLINNPEDKTWGETIHINT